jgi:hypothetical protein
MQSLGGAMHWSRPGLPLEAEYASAFPLRNRVEASRRAAPRTARSQVQRLQKKSFRQREGIKRSKGMALRIGQKAMRI